MELDELKSRWEAYDGKLDANLRLNARMLKSALSDKAETALNRLRRLVIAGLLIYVAIASALGAFLARHIAEPRYALPAGALQLCVIVTLIVCIRQLTAIARIDFGAPVLSIQKQIESLRIERLRVVKWSLIVSPLIWTPLFIVMMKGIFGIDVYATFSSTWLAANVLFGILVILVAVWVCRRYAGRAARSPQWQRIMRDIAGYNLSAAANVLRSLAQFEADEAQAG